MGKSKAPSVKKISRNKSKFTAEWKKGENYTDQDAGYRRYYYMLLPNPTMGYHQVEEPTGWTSLSPGKNKESIQFSPNFSEGKTWSKIEFRVRGQGNDKGDKESNWDYKTWGINPPNPPSVGMERTSSTKTTFSWEVPVSDTDHKMFERMHLYTALVIDTPIDNDKEGYYLPDDIWTELVYPDAEIYHNSGSWTFGDEDTSEWDLVHHSYTRWFKAVSSGPGGNGFSDSLGTDEVYAHRTYSSNVQPIEEITTEVEPRTTGGYNITYHFVSPYSTANPIDSAELQYYITTPVSTTRDEGGVRKTTLSVPNGASWQTARTITDVKNSATYPISIDTAIPNDNVVFVRVATTYEGVENGGAVTIPEGAYGSLPEPTGLAVGVPDPSTHRVSISATNNSAITASFLAIYYRWPDMNEQCIGIIPHGQSSQTVVLPTLDTDPTIVVRAYVADYSPISAGADTYSITNIKMVSTSYQGSGSVPKAPESINVTRKPNSTDAVKVEWDWAWTAANSAEISWSQDPDAWDSNNEPSTYMVSNTHEAWWYISGLSTGKWYFKVRLIQQTGEDVYYGAYSDMFGPVKIAEVPVTPRLTITPESGVVTEHGIFTCYWVYTSGDGTPQASAKIFEAQTDPITGELVRDSSGNILYNNEPIGEEAEAQHKTFNVAELGWSAGEIHYLSVQVTSASDEVSVGFSTPVKITVAEVLTPNVSSWPFVSYTFETIDEYGNTQQVTVDNALRSMPFTITVTGAGASGITTVAIEKDGYVKDSLPDERNEDIFDGTVVYLQSHVGEASFVINKSDLIGKLSDGQEYRLLITVQDSAGQVVNMAPAEFTVYWNVQPETAEAEIDYDPTVLVSYITPVPAEGVTPATGSVCDIYRLSVDKPELIVQNGEFNQTYVDRYPTLGEFGGYRIVSKSKYDDWVTDEGVLAWTDYRVSDIGKLDLFALVIDFDGNQLILPYDIDVSNTWTKDFEQTLYLGGSVVGDWNKAVTKSTSINLTIPIEYEPDNMRLLTALAEYADVCHIRTPDGSSFYANVTVKENKEKKMVRRKSSVSLEINRVDSQNSEPEGLTYEEWIRLQEE